MSPFLGKTGLIGLCRALPRVYLNDSSLKYSSGHREHTKGLWNPLCRIGDLAETTHVRAAVNNTSPPQAASLPLALLVPVSLPVTPVPGCPFESAPQGDKYQTSPAKRETRDWCRCGTQGPAPLLEGREVLHGEAPPTPAAAHVAHPHPATGCFTAFGVPTGCPKVGP